MKGLLTVSLILCLATLHLHAQSGSPFLNGFARISNTDSTFYIDTSGTPAFDSLSGSFELQDDTTGGTLPDNCPLVFKKTKMGALDLNGSWLLKPLYDSIDRRWPVAWKVSKDGKTSFFRRSGFMLPFTYEDATWLDSNYFAVKLNGKWGVYSRRDDKVLIPFEYDDIDYCSGCTAEGNYVFASREGKWGVVSFSNKLLVPFKYDHEHMNMRNDEWVECLWLDGKNVQINLNTGKVDTCICHSDDDDAQGTPLPFPLIGISKGDKYGVADTGGHIIVPCIYDQWFSTNGDSSLLLSGKGHRDILLDLHGKPVLPPGYDTLEELSSGLIRITKHGLLGLYNPHTKKITTPRYTRIEEVNYHLDRPVLEAYVGKKQGLIDADGTVVVPSVYDYVDDTQKEGLMWVKIRRKGILKTGLYSIPLHKLLIPVLYDDLSFYDDNEQLIRTQKGDHFGMTDPHRDTICALKYDDISEIDSALFLLKQHDSYSLYNATTHSIDTLPFDNIQIAGYGSLLIAETAGKRHLYDPEKKTFVPGNYDDITAFDHGIAVIFRKQPAAGSLYGFIDSTAKPIIPMEYDYPPDAYAGDFFQDSFLVLKKGDMPTRYGLASRNGKIIIPPIYDQIDILHPGTWFLVKKDDQWGLLDGQGNVFLPPTCVDLGAEPDHPLCFPLLYKTGDQWRYITKTGKVLPYTLNEIAPF